MRRTDGETRTRVSKVYRRATWAVLGVLTAALAGCCAPKTPEQEADPYFRTKGAFWVGAAVGGVPAVVVATPITAPLAALTEADTDATTWLMLGPGIPSGSVLGALFAAPVALFETLALPFRRARKPKRAVAEPGPAPG